MATKKDLVEAYTFSRRRLVTAFVSGAPGGREVEPVKPGRVLIGGIALSVLLLAGAAIAGFLLGRPPAQWLDQGSFIISKDTGEQYVVLRGGDKPVIQRVPNYVSAQLLLGKAELTPYTVRDKYIRTVTLGDDLGIPGAPASLPEPDQLIDDGWTACTEDRSGIKLVVRSEPDVQELSGEPAFLVRSGGKVWLIATASSTRPGQGRAYRFQFPGNRRQADTLATELGFGPTDQAPVVDADWLNLLPAGSALEPGAFGLSNFGQPVTYGGGAFKDLTVGTLVTTDSGASYLMGDNLPQPLKPFPAAVYSVVANSEVVPIASMDSSLDSPNHPSEWPQNLPDAVAGGEMCAVLHPDSEDPYRVTLANNPGPDATADDIDRGQVEVEVESSGGAYVISGADNMADGGTLFVVDTKGYKYDLVGSMVPGYLGYGDVTPVGVPNTWMTFFRKGDQLSTNAARRVPEDAPESGESEADSS